MPMYRFFFLNPWQLPKVTVAFAAGGLAGTLGLVRRAQRADWGYIDGIHGTPYIAHMDPSRVYNITYNVTY